MAKQISLTDAIPPGWVLCLCGCGGLVRDGGPEEESAWARVFAERGLVDPARFSPDEAYWQAVLTKESAGITGGE